MSMANSHREDSTAPSRRWAIAAALAFAGACNPLPIPTTGLHKFYLGQPRWGGIYWLLGWTAIPRVACAVEGIWYLSRLCPQDWHKVFSAVTANSTITSVAVSQQTQAIADAIRELEQLRQEGLISEQEFEQNRQSLLKQLT